MKNCKQDRTKFKPQRKTKLNLTKSENKLPNLLIKDQFKFMKGRNKFKTSGLIKLSTVSPRITGYNLHQNKVILQPALPSVNKTMIL